MFRQTSDDNFFADGGAESTAFATTSQSGTVVRDSTYRFRGQNSYRLDGSSQIAQRVRVLDPTAAMSVSVRYKTNSATSTFKGQARALTYASCTAGPNAATPGATWVTFASATVSGTSWTPYSATHAFSWAGTQGADVQLIANNGTPSTGFWVDDLRMANS